MSRVFYSDGDEPMRVPPRPRMPVPRSNLLAGLAPFRAAAPAAPSPLAFPDNGAKATVTASEGEIVASLFVARIGQPPADFHAVRRGADVALMLDTDHVGRGTWSAGHIDAVDMSPDTERSLGARTLRAALSEFEVAFAAAESDAQIQALAGATPARLAELGLRAQDGAAARVVGDVHERQVLDIAKVALHGRPWVRAVRLSTLEEDQRGVDIVVETDRDDIYVQVKSSVGGASKYRRQYGASPDLARTVVVIMGPGRGSEVATQIAGKVNDIWRKMGGAEVRTSPPMPAPPAPPTPLPSTVNGPVTQWQAMVDGANRRAERARAHAEAAIRDNNRLRQALRVAVLGLRELDGAAPALAAIERAAPGMTSEQFCFPERFTREERQAAALARDAGEDS